MASSFTTTGRILGLSRTAPTPAPRAPDCDCPPPCPACGLLECLCRPRFFPGMLLDDDDLTRLENYIVAKNRLHNRYLHGTGVVCGLEVVCDRCASGDVIVHPGYAISPCGDDIIVCHDASVNICDLINRCRPRDPCDPHGFAPPRDCKEGIQRWVLSICYEEHPSRGVKPMVSEPCGCSGSCGCGGQCGGSCGCGGGGKAAPKPAERKPTPASVAKYNPQCEPTLTCEGFTFAATKYLPPSDKPDDRYGVVGLIQSKAKQFGPLLTRLLHCLIQYEEVHAKSLMPTGQPTQVEIATAYGTYVDALQAFVEAHATHRCDLLRRLTCIDRPKYTIAGSANWAVDNRDAASDAGLSERDWKERYAVLEELLRETLRDCFCSALLPPCPMPQPTNCVPLAVVTINADTCEVLEICNWSARKFLVTVPTLAYWTSFINWGALQEGIAKLCCGTMDPRLWGALIGTLSKSVQANAPAMPGNAAFAAAAAPTAPVPSTLDGLFALVGQATRPDGMAHMLAAAGSSDSDVADLKAAVAALQRQVETQQAEIERLARQH